MANGFYISVKAAKQGDLKGESGKVPTRIHILGFNYGVQSPRDPASGLPTGKRIHHPITVYKEWGVISPQLFEAMVTNENLPMVVIEEVRINPKGQEAVYMEIRLTNANISEIEIDPERASTPPLWTNREIERVSFTFQKIEIENKASKVTAQDDWEARV
jgi:type VI secretion system secreted protein Hcp